VAPIKNVGIALIVAGFLGVAYGGFTYTRQTNEAKIGPLTLSVVDKETINIPIWVGLGGIVLGGLLRVLGNKRS
jgi:hypothetical protein